jgi:hypothetical protein
MSLLKLYIYKLFAKLEISFVWIVAAGMFQKSYTYNIQHHTLQETLDYSTMKNRPQILSFVEVFQAYI